MWLTQAVGWAPAWLWYLFALGLLLYLFGIWPYITSTIALPGPKPLPYVGNMLQENRLGIMQSERLMYQKYGSVFLTWRGRQPTINIADPDMVKQICVKDFPNFTNRKRQLPLSPTRMSMLVFLEDDHWKFVRSVLTPAFSSGKMRKMGPLINNYINRLLENLSKLSETKKSFDAKSVVTGQGLKEKKTQMATYKRRRKVVHRVMSGLTMEVIGAVGFGIDTDVQKDLNDRFLTMASKVFDNRRLSNLPVVIGFLFPSLLPVLEAVGWTFDSKTVTDFFVRLLKRTIDERRTHPKPRKDLLQLILDSSVEDLKETLADKDVDVDALKTDNHNMNKKLTDIEVIAQTFLFLIAGYETTSSALAFFTYNMALHPECQKKLIGEIDEALKGAEPTYDNVMTLPYLDMCLSETQRLYPAVKGVQRVAKQSTVIKGLHIPAGSMISMLAYVLQHDEKYWPDPERFDPQRWTPEQKAVRHPYVYFPFGAGPRNCVGMRLAQMEAKMAVVAMMQKFRFVRAPETEVPLTLGKGVFTKAVNGIWLRVESRD